MTEKFVWPADMPPREIGTPGAALDGRPAWIIKTSGRSLGDEFSWVLNTTYGPYGWSVPTTHKSRAAVIGYDRLGTNLGPGFGKTRTFSGLISRRGYVRIIRE